MESDLLSNILPFWLKHAIDTKRGCFHGSVSSDLVPDPNAVRGALLTSRILWTFSAAYRRYRTIEYLRMADFAYVDLISHFHDARHGGFFWSLRPDGTVLQDRKQVYGQAFALYGLSEYHAASGRPEPLELAIEVHRLLEKHALDPTHGGYLEALGREWQAIPDMRLSGGDMNVPKSQNTLLHVMEAYACLLRVWPNPDLERSQISLLKVMLDHVLQGDSGHLGLFFSADWQPKSDQVSYGHDIEAAWLLTQAGDGVDDAPLRERIRKAAVRIADVTLAEGVDSDGGVMNQGGPQGLTNTGKDWWPQAEAVIGFLNAYEIGRQPKHLDAALRSWEFIDSHLIDRTRGEWIRSVDRDGRPSGDPAKISFWKCPYHNGRMVLESVARLRRLAPS
ncbi:MAG: AGE family epimerase/isomerase [Opitutaceae bacterium]